MKRPGSLQSALSCVLVLALSAGVARGTAVQDLVRIRGHETVVLTGLGIVVGLDGTGDTSKESLIAARPYARLLDNLGDPVGDAAELLQADAYAIVTVTMEVPPSGARDGDRFDVSVEKLFNAESLAGGRLVVSLLRLPLPDAPELQPMAFAQGPLIIQGEDVSSAIVRGGGQMLADVRPRSVAPDGTMTLILKDQYAGYPVATMLAGAIDDEFAIDGLSHMTFVEDPRNIRIYLPESDRRNPAQFIATLMTIPIDPSLIRTGARIVINERAGIITATGNVQIGPVAITHKGMQLSNLAAPPPPPPPGDTAAAQTSLTPRRWVGVDTTDGTGRNSTRLTDLLAAFERLSVPAPDQIAIIYELRKTGALHAEIISE